MFKTVAIIAAAGQGKRMGSQVNKQYLTILDKPVLAYTVQIFQYHPAIDEIIIVAKEDEINFCYQEVVLPYKLSKVRKIVPGGKERQDSVYQGLLELPAECNLVVVHDGARPFVTQDIISKALAAAKSHNACIVAVPVKDTIKRVDDSEFVQGTLTRAELWAVQTPQVFQKQLLFNAYKKAREQGLSGTDDASLVENIGAKVKVVLGSYENIKITTPEDIEIGCAILANRGKEKTIFAGG